MSKFNKYNTLLETAFSHYSNGGFREGTPVKLKKSFLSHPYYKTHYSGDQEFASFITDLIEREYMFWIKRVVGHAALQNPKDSNDNEGAGNVYLVLKMDPRTVQFPTEFAEFTVPGDYNHVEVQKFGVNLPPVQGVANRYELPFGNIKPEPVSDNLGIDNLPKDRKLPTKNVKIKTKK
jgi:hypothetical protein